MKLKIFGTFILSTILFVSVIAQDNNRHLYSVSICKTNNDGNNISEKIFEIDSLGNILNQNKKMTQKVDINEFSKGIAKYVVQENIVKDPGNDYITIIEAAHPKLNEQSFIITVIFLDDYYKEKKLRNKTSYTWGKHDLSKNTNDYPFFKYLNPKDINIIKSLLE